MIGYVADAVRALAPERTIVVIGYQGDKVKAYLGEGFTYAVQEVQLGTGHALLTARGSLGQEDADLLLVYVDIPLLRPETLSALLACHREEGATASVLTAIVDDPTGYGRIVRDRATGGISHIVEDADASPAEKDVREINTGIYCFRVPDCLPYLDRLGQDNLQGEVYLVDLVPLLLQDGYKVATLTAIDPFEVEGVNSRVQLARAEAAMRTTILRRLMSTGVTVVDPGSTYVDWGVEVGPDTVLEPGTVLRGVVTVGSRCVIGPFTYIEDSLVADDCRVWNSVVEGSRILTGAKVGPFSHLRPGAVLEEDARIGNFAEVKNSRVARGAKIQHHSYIGDADIGAAANIGAGAVIVNYDGVAKHRTVVGEGAFVGCNTNLVAPVSVGDGAYTAAGSTVTRPVPPGSLAVSRARQENIEGWVERRRPGTVSARAAGRAREAGKPLPEDEAEPRDGPEEGAE
jgi:bifunctional UDP-N-acetylglucosamine pyrophosphorylase/glucosamine-1-phosphate N-acetyltransferase